MKKILLLSLGVTIFFTTSLYAQVINDSGQHGKMYIQTKKGPTNNTLDGSPYENEAFQSGKIAMAGKEPINAYLRYDVLNDEIEVKKEKSAQDIYVIADKKGTNYKIGQINFVFENFQFEGQPLQGYFQEYYNGENVRLLKRLTTTITDPVKAQTGYQKDKPARIIIQENYFLAFNDGNIKEVRLKERDFKKALPNSKAASEYLGDHKVRDLEDFVKMLQWYDRQ